MNFEERTREEMQQATDRARAMVPSRRQQPPSPSILEVSAPARRGSVAEFVALMRRILKRTAR